MDKHWRTFVEAIPQQPQTQEPLRNQLFKAWQLANRAGLYDAADAIERTLMKER